MAFRTEIVCAYLYVITRYGYPPSAADTPKHLEQMAAMGFTSVELEGIREGHIRQMYDLRGTVRDHLKRLNLNVPYFCVVLPGLSSPDAAVRSRNLEAFRLGCETAFALGALGVLDNAPLPPYVFPDDIPVVRHYDEDVLRMARFPSDLDWPKYWESMTATYRQACDIAAEYGLAYLMHPCLGVLSATADAFLHFHQAVDRENLRFNFDTANQFFLKDNLDLAMLRLAPYVDYIHISDSHGEQVEHLPPGEGAIRWEPFFERLRSVGFKGHIGIDVGGEEHGLSAMDDAYVASAEWTQTMMSRFRL